ncbi:flagellar export chaperone FliS [bacterium]|nr:flagellar export chaperone FliS [bacterium]
MKKNPIKEYRQVQIQTASQEQLIVLMYQHAVRSVQIAKDAMPTKKYDTVSNNIIKAQDIVTELMVSLKMEAGPISQNLYRLYDYMNRRLIEANMKKDASILSEIEKMLSSLLDTWEDLLQKNQTGQSSGTPASTKPPPPPGVSGGFSVSG